MVEVIVGIDFGSWGTGYAYSFNDPQNIDLGKFPGQTTQIKVPTEIILDSTLQNIISFGTECCKHKLKNDELYFKRIKMSIYYNLNFIRPENNSTNYDLVKVVSKVFEFIKKEAIVSIHYNRSNITEEQIKWIVTVPSIWNYSQKSIMIQACEKAGLFNKNTDRGNFLALEAEAASIYCLNDNSVDSRYLKSGKTYIVCDLGGGTGDLVTHHRVNENKIIEKYRSIGGPYGSEEIDREFFNKVFKELFGFETFNSLKDKFNKLKLRENSWNETNLYNAWSELQEKIGKIKLITDNLRDQSFTINCQIFEDFVDGAKLEDLVSKFNNSCREGWKVLNIGRYWQLDFPYKILFDLIENHAIKISEQISEILENANDIESILYVGGYCSNEILLNILKSKFPKLIHMKPSCPERAVVKGAVLFGIDPSIINSRKAMFTIGFNCDDNWDEKIHGGIGEKYYDSRYNIYKCKNSFHAFIRKGQDLSQNDYVEQSFITMNSRIILLKFFKSDKVNPVLWTEKGVELIGNEQLDLGKDFPEGERSFILRLKFGGTYAVASCSHCNSGREFSFPLYFNQ